MEEQTKILLEQFDVTRYKGYKYVIEAIIYMCSHDREYIKITRQIYPLVADKFMTKSCNIERDIRTLIEKCWIRDKKLLARIAGCKLYCRPTNSDFIDYFAVAILNKYSA